MSFKKQALTNEYIHAVSNEQQSEKLYKINLTSHNISCIESSIKKYNRLRCLILDFNYIQQLTNLNALFDLRQLHLEGNTIEKIEGLETCKNITVLNLAANRIEKIQKLAHLGKLEHLNLSKNRLSKISNLESLKELKVLNLASNSITSLESLPAFSKVNRLQQLQLDSLVLSNNKIAKIPANVFANAAKMTKLDLGHNKLSDTTFLGKLAGLEYLNLGHNQVTAFSLEAPLKYLEQLNLETNQLQELPNIGQYLPQLVILSITNNMFCSEHDLISTLSENQMLTEFYFSENPVHTKEFEETLYHLYKFDRINATSYNQPGHKYLSSIKQIESEFRTEFHGVEDDEDDRKIKMSGFYNDELENRMSGLKPHRPVSPATKKARAILNDDGKDIQRNFEEFEANHKKLGYLREMYQKICSENNIQKPEIESLQQRQRREAEEFLLTQQQNAGESQNKNLTLKGEVSAEDEISELRLRNDNNEKVMKSAKREKEQKWAQLKARTKQKNFNIRRSRTKQINKSLSKNSMTELQKERQGGVSSDLMKTQQVPPRRPFESAILASKGVANGAKTFYRPNSQRKISTKKIDE